MRHQIGRLELHYIFLEKDRLYSIAITEGLQPSLMFIALLEFELHMRNSLAQLPAFH